MPPNHHRHQKRPADERPEIPRPDIPRAAYVQAYEAQLIYGQSDYAQKLFTIPTPGASDSQSGGRGALIKWEGEEEEEIWVDRYDILHLLPSLPSMNDPGPSTASRRPASPAPTSSSGDSEPSDMEDTFFLSGSEEMEEYERGKKRRWMEALREERLRERAREDATREFELSGRGERSGWGGDDEVPPDLILTLMSHTAHSLLSSPNPSLLEIRILANHATDKRFAFLRGRWADAWALAKAKARRMKAREEAPLQRKAVGALVGGYESSDEDEGGGEREPSGSPPPPPPEEPPRLPSSPPAPEDKVLSNEIGPKGDQEEENRRLRRVRAEEWKRKRTQGDAA